MDDEKKEIERNEEKGAKGGSPVAESASSGSFEGKDKTAQMMALEQESVIQTYTRQPILLVRGSGAKVWDATEKST